MIHLTQAQYDELQAAKAERDRLLALINTPELVDFPKAVHLESVHQVLRHGAEHDAGKTPADWFWLVGHLGTRALEHHKEAERLQSLAVQPRAMGDRYPSLLHVADGYDQHIAHHREKAAHHCITAAAAISNWHAAVVGKATVMRPGIAEPQPEPTGA